MKAIVYSVKISISHRIHKKGEQCMKFIKDKLASYHKGYLSVIVLSILSFIFSVVTRTQILLGFVTMALTIYIFGKEL